MGKGYPAGRYRNRFAGWLLMAEVFPRQGSNRTCNRQRRHRHSTPAYELLDTEWTGANADEARADQLAKERNELAAALVRMMGKVEALTSQVAQLTDKVTSSSAENARLRAQIGGAT